MLTMSIEHCAVCGVRFTDSRTEITKTTRCEGPDGRCVCWSCMIEEMRRLQPTGESPQEEAARLGIRLFVVPTQED